MSNPNVKKSPRLTVNLYLIAHQIALLIWTYPHFFLLPQKETLAKKRGHENMLPITHAGARPHFREANARLTLKDLTMHNIKIHEQLYKP
jgi:hypothetical protein